jgi:periplasmic protein TonB
MTPRPKDLLDERDPIRNPLAGSVLLHALVFGGLTLNALWQGRARETFGDMNSLGSASVGVTPVKQLPFIAKDGDKNPVASDTESQVPTPPPPPKPQPKQVVREDPDAIALKSRKVRKSAPVTHYDEKKMPPRDYRENQVTSQVGQAVTSPLYGMAPGSGGVGVGNGTPFGSRFGGYAQLVRDRVAQKWRTDDVDPRVNAAPPTIVIFEILRDGHVQSIRVGQSSNLLSLDNSARRAVLEAAPFPPLPAGYDGSSATIEFWFQLKR